VLVFPYAIDKYAKKTFTAVAEAKKCLKVPMRVNYSMCVDTELI